MQQILTTEQVNEEIQTTALIKYTHSYSPLGSVVAGEGVCVVGTHSVAAFS